MRILKIELENIHSLKGLHSIDFEKGHLKNAGIFAIVGPTGAGKSTILDVITLALFKRISRVDGTISSKDIVFTGAVMTRGTQSAYAAVEYENAGKRYRSKFSISKKIKNFDPQMELADAITNQIIETGLEKVPAENERIIGLNFNQFVKSIILPQGKFTEFLRARPDERANFLEKITGTEIYRDIGKRAFEINKLYEEAVKTQAYIVDNIKPLTEQELEEIEILKKSKELEKKNIAYKIEELRIQINNLKQYLQINDNINKNKTLLTEIETKLKEFNQQQQSLEIHKKLLPYKTDFYKHNQLQNQILKNLQNIEKLINSIDDNSKIISQLNDAITVQKNTLYLTQETYNKAKEKLSTANDLNTNVKLVTERLQTLQNQLLENDKSIEQVAKDIETNKSRYQTLQLEYDTLKNWLQQHKQLEELQNQAEYIKNLIKTYENLKKETEIKIQNFALRDIFKNSTWKNYSNIIQKTIDEFNKQLSHLESQITQQIDLDHFKQIIYDFTQKIEKIQNLKNLSENFINENATIKQLQKEIQEIISQNKILDDKNQNIYKQLNDLENVLETYKQQYSIEQLQIKYSEDRKKLTPDTPCPLCGSLHHPFVDKYQQPDTSSTQKIILETEKQIKQLNKQIIETQENIKFNNTKLQELQDKLTKCNTKTEELSNNFKKLNNDILSNFDIQQTNEIEKYLNDVRLNYTQFTHNYELITQKNQLLSQIQHLLIVQTDVSNTLSYHTEITQTLSPYREYIKNIQTLEQIIEKLENLKEQYATKLKHFNDCGQKINVIQAEVQILEQNKKQLNTQRNQILQLIETQQKIQQQAIAQYQLFLKENFDNHQPQKYFDNLETKINSLQNEINNKINQLTRLETENNQNSQQLLELQTENTQIQKDFEILQQELTKKIINLGFDNIEAAQSLILKDEIANQIEEMYNKLIAEKEKTTNTITILQKQIQELETKINKDTTSEDLEKQLSKYENQLSEIEQQLGGINEKLINNLKLQKQKLAEQQKLEKLKNTHRRWEILKKVIGDAEGKTFNAIAQKITLNELIGLANKHLKYFTDRYILDITDEIKNDFFVIDKYLGYTTRSVYTVSGGESFLISLSLALALSDLASQNVKIQTLFIDEGFGTLDNEALDQALRYLEKLHSDFDRTIGIISHVPQIKERIFSKIVLNKANTGFSTISFE